MIKPTFLCIVLLSAAVCGGCREAESANRLSQIDESKPTAVATPTRSEPRRDGDELVQFSLLAALAAGDYVGGAPLTAVRESGDFGVGTFDRLDGEMIVLNGEIFQVQADGNVVPRTDAGTTPFATVKFFTPDGNFAALTAASLTELDHEMDRRVPDAKRPVAIKISGEFAELTLRSAPPQQPPYRPLVEVIDQQRVWQRQQVRGTLIGFRCPQWMGTINVAGYHWHFLSDDRSIGGHVLDCRFTDAEGAYDVCSSLLIRLPESSSFTAIDMGGVTDAHVDKIERQRGDSE